MAFRGSKTSPQPHRVYFLFWKPRENKGHFGVGAISLMVDLDTKRFGVSSDQCFFFWKVRCAPFRKFDQWMDG